ncbi:UTP--glucose-1-phosphate uridylyltransferase [Patescibacteria group bacterium]|nr:UTP--glucose-1-phosphate uridylyltransferase [Patescibacteria group bacterium]
MIKKAIIPVAGLGTRFLPLSKVMPKELWPLVDKPVIQYILEELRASGISEIIFVISSEKKVILDYFKKSPKIEKVLRERKKGELLRAFQDFQDFCQDFSISYVFQKKPLGDGHAFLQAAKLIKKEPCVGLFADDVVESKVPCTLQLSKIFKTCQKPVVALHRVGEEKIPYYGIAKVEKIASRLYKIKEIVEKPSVEEAPSNLAIVGKYVLTPEVFSYLKEAKSSEGKVGMKSGEIILGEVLNKMLKDGKVIYGYEFDGKWLECGNKLDWLKSHLYLSLKDPQFGQGLKEFLKET